MMDGGLMSGWGGFGLAGALINFLILAGLLALLGSVVVKALATQGVESERSGARTDPAEQILRERFARGEMDAGEYERSLKALREHSAHATYEDYVRAVDKQTTAER